MSSIILPERPTLATLFQAAQAQLITFDAVVREQQARYPRCIPHGTPTAFTLDGVALCEACEAAHHDYITKRLRGEG